MILASTAVALLSLCSASEFVQPSSLYDIFKGYVSDPNGPEMRSIKYGFNAESWEDTLKAAVSPVTLNALKIVTSSYNQLWSAEQDNGYQPNLSEMAVKLIEYIAPSFMEEANANGVIDGPLKKSLAKYQELFPIAAGDDGILSADEYATMMAAASIFESLVGQKSYMDSNDWNAFVGTIPFISDKWTFEMVAGSDGQLSMKEFTAFMFFVCTSEGDIEITADKWTAMGGDADYFSMLAGEDNVLQYFEWYNVMCAEIEVPDNKDNATVNV